MTDLSQIEKDLIHLWENFHVEPKCLQMTMGNYRKFIAPHEDLQEFLAETQNVPDDAIVVLTPGKVTLLTDDDRNLLGFS